tara:strand:+ start:323 stop:976 length:654 start_codon:yes stop_codon:yes gene_type:complete
MATVKEYAYYIKGTKLALIEKDTAFDNDPNSRDYGPGSEHANWKSPITAITNGIELEYVYSPEYRINDDSDTAAITGYDESGTGLLKFLSSSAFPTSGITHIVVTGSDKWNGLHKIDTFTSSSAMIVKTKYSGSTVTEASTMYKDVTALIDEDSKIDLPSYLSKALVYYVKARIAEDGMNLEGKEYFMKEFRKMVEKYDSTRYPGARRIVSGFHAIR